jgi:hypothetical protein
VRLKYVPLKTKGGRSRSPNGLIKVDRLGTYIYSYDTIIAFINENNKVYLNEGWWCHSNTTGYYRNEAFNYMGLNEYDSKPKLEKAIKEGKVTGKSGYPLGEQKCEDPISDAHSY